MQSYDLSTGFNESIYFDYVPQPTFAGHLNKLPFRIVITSSNDNPHLVTLKSRYSKSYDSQENPSKWSFLRPESRFFDLSGNEITSIVTNDTPVYKDENGNLNSVSGLFLGVSGYAEFYFTDDIYNYDLSIKDKPYSTIVAVLQTSSIDYFDTKASSHILNTNFTNSQAVAYQPHIFKYRDPDYIKISENGIRDFINPRWTAANQHVVFSFSWDPIISEGLNLTPLKNDFNKSIPSSSNTDPIEIYVNSSPTKVYFNESPNILVEYKNKDNYLSPGYNKTYFNLATGVSNLTLSAYATFQSPDTTGLNYTPRLWLSNPNAGMINITNYNFPFNYNLNQKLMLKANVQNVNMPILFEQNFRNIDENYESSYGSNFDDVHPEDQEGEYEDPYATSGYHDINSIAVLPYPEEAAWMIDGELNNLYKVDSYGIMLTSINLLNLVSANTILPYEYNQLSPASITLDKNLNLWITLYDNQYVLNLDKDGNFVGFLSLPYQSGIPNINQEWYANQQPYPDDGMDQNYIQPTIVDTDNENGKNYIWVSYSNYASGFLVKFDELNYIQQTITYPVCACPQDIIVDNQHNIWVALSNDIYNSIGSLEKRDTNGNLISSFGPIIGLNELALDLDQNLWFTYSYSRIGVIDNKTLQVTTFDVLENSNFSKVVPLDVTNPSKNTDETALEGIACDLKGYVYVVNSIENQVYVYNSKTKTFVDKFYVNPQGFVFWNPYELGPTNIGYSEWNKSLQAHGDWMGTRWINKYHNNTNTYTISISGQSSPLNFLNIPSTNINNNYSFLANTFFQYLDTDNIQQILVRPQHDYTPTEFYWNIDIFKVNENFDLSQNIYSYAFMTNLYESQYLFNVFLPSIYGKTPFNHDDLGVAMYEKISNFILNNSDIDTCEISSLYSIADSTNTSTDDYLLSYPDNTKRLMNLLSINPSKLFGSVPKNLKNFDEPDSNYLYNKGNLLSDSSIVYAGDSVILKTKSLGSYEIIQTGFLQNYDLDKVSNSINNFIDIISNQLLPVNVINRSITNFTYTFQYNGVAPKTYPSGDTSSPTRKMTSDLIKANRSKIQQQVIEWVNYNYPYTLTDNTLSAKCYRDVGYILDAVAADVENAANHRCIEVGDLYFKGPVLNVPSNDGSGVPTLPKNEVVATLSAMNALKAYITGQNIPKEIPSFTVTGLLTSARGIDVSNLINNIIYPLENRGNLLPYNPAGTSNSTQINAAKLITAKRSDIQGEITNYVNVKGYLSDHVSLGKCERDSGLMVDAIVNDLITGVDSRSIEYALAYWDGSTSRLPQDKIPNQIANTIDTINYLGLILNSITKNTVTTQINNSINNFTSIIQSLNNVPATTPNGNVSDSSYTNAAEILLSNKQNLQQQIVNYVQYYFPYALSTNQTLSAKCYRDIGYIVDALAADISNNANHRSIEVGNLYFVGTLLNPTDIGNTTVPTLPDDQVSVTIQAIEIIKNYLTGQNLPNIPNSIIKDGILSSMPLQRLTEVNGLIETITYPLKTGGEKLPYNPAGNPTDLDIQTANIFLKNRTNIQDYVSKFVAEAGFISYTVYDEQLLAQYEQKCYRDIGLMVDAIVNDLTTGVYSKSIEYALAYWDGSTSRLPLDTIPNHVKYMISTVNYLFQYLLSFSVKNNQIPKTTPNGKIYDASYELASNSILAFKEQLQEQIIDYSNYFYPNALAGNSSLSAKCFRDAGYIIDAIAADIANNANHRSIDVSDIYFSGAILNQPTNYYSTIPLIPQNQVDATIAAISAIGSYITGDGIINYPSSLNYFTSAGILSSVDMGSARKDDVIARVNDIIYTLQNNGQKNQYNPPGNPNSKDLALADLLASNRTTIQQQVSSYVDAKGYIRDNVAFRSLIDLYQQKCTRDVGFMVDAVVNDLRTGVVSKSIQYALAYWDGSTSRIPQTDIPNQQDYTIDTINYLGSILIQINPDLLTPVIMNAYPVSELATSIGITKNNDYWQGYYEFYNYIPTDNNTEYQDNLIDWHNPQTTLTNNITSIFDWSGDERMLDTFFSYDLYTGLGIF
jgi:hypothetical protein